MVFLDWVFGLLASMTPPDDNSPALGDLYLALGSLSVKLKMFLLSLIVLRRGSSGLSSDVAWVDAFSSGKNFFTKDSIIGRDNI